MTILRIISFGMDKYWAFFDIKQQTKSEHLK